MSERKYRAAIVGLGFIGAGDQVSGDRLGQQVAHLDGTHLEALARHPQVEVVAGSSRESGRRERFEARTGRPTFADWREMLATVPLDMVSVATYTPTHAEIVLACAARGTRAILCEKPIAASLIEAEQMLAACQQSGSLLVINHNRRFHPHFRSLAARIRDGAIGELTGGWLTWGAGRLGNVGTHFIDAALMLTGQTIRRVSAKLDLSGRPDCRGPEFQDPGGWAQLQLESGAMLHVHAPDYGNSPGEFILHGTKGRADIAGGVASIRPWGGSIELLPPVDPAAGTSMDQAVREMVAHLNGTGPMVDPARSAVQTLEVILACHASHDRNGSWVDLPLTGADRDRVVHSG